MNGKIIAVSLENKAATKKKYEMIEVNILLFWVNLIAQNKEANRNKAHKVSVIAAIQQKLWTLCGKKSISNIPKIVFLLFFVIKKIIFARRKTARRKTIKLSIL